MNGQFKGECECVSASCYIKQWYSKKREMRSGKYNERWRWHLSHRARPHKAYIYIQLIKTNLAIMQGRLKYLGSKNLIQYRVKTG